MVDVQTSGPGHGSKPTPCRISRNVTINKENFAIPQPNTAQLDVRRGTFSRVPMDDVVRAGFNPSRLAEAGLLYEYDESADTGWYRCYRCQLRENSWPFSEDPVLVHAKKSPSCSFIAELRGKRRTNEQRINLASHINSSQNNTIGSDNNRNDSIEKTCRTVRKGLESDGVCTNPSVRTNPIKSSQQTVEDLKKDIRRLDNSCKACNKEIKEILFLPCAHIVACEDCSINMKNCITCGKEILGTARVYFG